MRHRNETGGWHVCAGRATHIVDLDPTVARIGVPTYTHTEKTNATV